MGIDSSIQLATVPNFDEYKFVQNRYMRTKVVFGRGLHKAAAQSIFNGGYKDSRHFLVTDKTVNKFYGDLMESVFVDAGYTVTRVICDDSEMSKSFGQFERICTEMLDVGFDKNSFVISLGGGVVNNLAGFIASTLYRGINLAHIPTSLLAQVDAAIDFKQALNTNHGKNLVGSYYPASVVLVDPFFLRTLEDRHLYNGLAESIKHALAQDLSFFDYLSSFSGDCKSDEFEDRIIRDSIVLKTKLMSNASEETIDEIIKQYGHAIGHAIEHLSKGGVLHGEAISIGMCVSAVIAENLGFGEKGMVSIHERIFKKYNLPTKVPANISNESILKIIRYDKHFRKGKAFMGLLKSVAKPASSKESSFEIPIDLEQIGKALTACRGV